MGCRVYVGELVDPELGWRSLDDHWQRNVREVRSVGAGMNLMLSVVSLIEDGDLDGGQADWGAWIAEVDRDRLLALYPTRKAPDVSAWRPFLPDLSDEQIIDKMNFDPSGWIGDLPDKPYLLVAIEDA